MNDENEITEEVLDFARNTLSGDMRDRILGLVKALPDVWQKMSEMDQRSYAQTVETMAESIIREAVQIIVSDGRPCITASLEQYTEKDGLKITLKAAGRSETVEALHQSCGERVYIIAAPYDDYCGERKEAEIDEDAPTLFDQTTVGEKINEESDDCGQDIGDED